MHLFGGGGTPNQLEQTQRWQRCGFSRQIFKFFSGKYVQGFKGKDGHEHAQIGNLSRNGDLNKNQIEKKSRTEKFIILNA